MAPQLTLTQLTEALHLVPTTWTFPAAVRNSPGWTTDAREPAVSPMHATPARLAKSNVTGPVPAGIARDAKGPNSAITRLNADVDMDCLSAAVLRAGSRGTTWGPRCPMAWYGHT